MRSPLEDYRLTLAIAEAAERKAAQIERRRMLTTVGAGVALGLVGAALLGLAGLI